MIPDIIIPTCKDLFDISPLIGEVSRYCRDNLIVATCLRESAAHNRNFGLQQCKSEIVIMMDDDIMGFDEGWDKRLIRPLIEEPDIIYVTARLLNADGSLQRHMGFSENTRSAIVDIPICPTACVAFRNDGLRFDEGYVGSGWEDTDFAYMVKEKYPTGRIVVNNLVRLTHLNEMKNQMGNNYTMNRDYFNRKWGKKL